MTASANNRARIPRSLSAASWFRTAPWAPCSTPRRFYQPLLRRAESLFARPGPPDPPGLRQGRREIVEPTPRRQPHAPAVRVAEKLKAITRPACAWLAKPPEKQPSWRRRRPMGVRIEPLGPPLSPRPVAFSGADRRASGSRRRSADPRTFGNLNELAKPSAPARSLRGESPLSPR